MELSEFINIWNNHESRILVQTSGSTGKPKAMFVEKSRMLSSARITCDFLGLKKGDTALLCMSLDYIAGKMMVVRSIERNMELISVKPSNHPLSDIERDITFAAMVPSQVYCSLQVNQEKEKLKSIKNLIIGGGPISLEIEKELKSFPNNVYSTYGMTETLSHIALRKVNADTNNRDADWYIPFEGVNLSQAEDGCLVIDAPEVSETIIRTNDIVEFRVGSPGFKIVGRKDNVIISGGVKLHIEEIEQKLEPYIKGEFCISKREDEKFGEVVVLLLKYGEGNIKTSEIDFSSLNIYQRPKVTKYVKEIPYTETGKIDRKHAFLLASEK